MIKPLVILSILFINLFADEFTIASFNVENFFDLKNNRTEYVEYIPNNKYNWNKKTFNTKLQNISKVIQELNPNILALQEIESKRALKQLQTTLPQYKYSSFVKYKNSSIGLAILSKIKILNTSSIQVKFSNKIFRPIHEVTFEHKKIKFKIFNNHWPSKRVDERYRIKYAYTLFSRTKKLSDDYDYVILGDLNANYNEFETFLNNKKLNTTSHITGINQVLNTTINNKLIRKYNILNFEKRVHYNLWLDIKYKERFSYIYRGEKETPDHIILSPALFDNKKISYKNNSFRVYKPDYLYKNRTINRWKTKKRVHLNRGFSDHLPIIASFNISKFKKEKKNSTSFSKLEELYKVDNLKYPALFKDCVVIFKDKYGAIIKQKDSKAIYIYKKNHNLKLGFSYDLKVDEIKRYNGLKEIVNFEVLKKNQKVDDFNSFYIKNIDDFNKLKYQNEIVINLDGSYKKNYFYYNNHKIKIFFKNKSIKPKNSRKLFIKKAQIGFYRSKPQLVIYTREDFE